MSLRLLALPAVAAVPSASLAQAPPGGGPRANVFISPCGQPWRSGDGEPYPLFTWFAATDVDHDGSVDIYEFRADHERFFEALDQDHNGVLDSAEISFYEKRVGRTAQRALKRLLAHGPI